MLLALPNSLTFSNRIYEIRSYPLKVFSRHMKVDENTRIMLTPKLWEKHRMLEGTSLLKLYFLVDIPDENIIKSDEWNGQWSADYVFAAVETLQEWQLQNQDIHSKIIREPQNKVVLLCAPGKCID